MAIRTLQFYFPDFDHSALRNQSYYFIRMWSFCSLDVFTWLFSAIVDLTFTCFESYASGYTFILWFVPCFTHILVESRMIESKFAVGYTIILQGSIIDYLVRADRSQSASFSNVLVLTRNDRDLSVATVSCWLISSKYFLIKTLLLTYNVWI